jgi:hypothetical protein
MSFTKTMLIAAAIAAGGAGVATANPILLDLPSSTYITVGGLDWTWASAVSSVDFFGYNTLSDPSLHAGWRYATVAEFAARPDRSAFLDGNGDIIQSTIYWNTVFDFADFDNALTEVNRVIVPDDDLTNYYEIFYVRGGDVPEPASWALMLAGFGLIGFAMRRRATHATA